MPSIRELQNTIFNSDLDEVQSIVVELGNNDIDINSVPGHKTIINSLFFATLNADVIRQMFGVFLDLRDREGKVLPVINHQELTNA